uniref:Uncharacterized protein n=1 Tax=candidate division CPR3 bacterium TaxID=2268181 RepID=A0A7C4R7X8_UNCC3
MDNRFETIGVIGMFLKASDPLAAKRVGETLEDMTDEGLGFLLEMLRRNVEEIIPHEYTRLKQAQEFDGIAQMLVIGIAGALKDPCMAEMFLRATK